MTFVSQQNENDIFNRWSTLFPLDKTRERKEKIKSILLHVFREKITKLEKKNEQMEEDIKLIKNHLNL